MHHALARLLSLNETRTRPSLLLSQDMRVGQVCHDCAMVYLLLLSGAKRTSSVNALLQNWYSGLLHHKDYFMRTQWSAVVGALAAAARASTQELRYQPPQLLATEINAMPSTLQCGASFPLCAFMVDKEVRNASTSLEHTHAMLSSDSAACTASAWLAAAAASRSTTANLERLDTAAAVAEVAVTTAAIGIAAVQHRRAREQQTPESAAAQPEKTASVPNAVTRTVRKFYSCQPVLAQYGTPRSHL
jgi:hypothetical protein